MLSGSRMDQWKHLTEKSSVLFASTDLRVKSIANVRIILSIANATCWFGIVRTCSKRIWWIGIVLGIEISMDVIEGDVTRFYWLSKNLSIAEECGYDGECAGDSEDWWHRGGVLDESDMGTALWQIFSMCG